MFFLTSPSLQCYKMFVGQSFQLILDEFKQLKKIQEEFLSIVPEEFKYLPLWTVGTEVCSNVMQAVARPDHVGTSDVCSFCLLATLKAHYQKPY